MGKAEEYSVRIEIKSIGHIVKQIPVVACVAMKVGSIVLKRKSPVRWSKRVTNYLYVSVPLI